MFTLLQHICTPLVVCAVRISQSVIFCVVVCGSLFVLLTLSYIKNILSARQHYKIQLNLLFQYKEDIIIISSIQLNKCSLTQYNCHIVCSCNDMIPVSGIYSILSFMCIFCRSLFVLLSFFIWSLCCLFFFDIRILITPLVSPNSFYQGSRTQQFIIT